MAKLSLKNDGKIRNRDWERFWSILGWTLAVLLSVIMAKGAF